MKQFFIDNSSNSLIIFFTGWGCDEYEFEHLKAKSDVLILYDYTNLKLDFDFSEYKEFYLIAFSAGVFIASLFNFDFKINKKIAVDGNPHLFDEHFGLSKEIQHVLYNVSEETADDFAKNYLVKTKNEIEKFHHSKRTIDSCKHEFEILKKLYKTKKHDIKDIYDIALIGDCDTIFNITAQKEFYGNKLHIIKDCRHNPFFKIEYYEQLIDII